ncbi:MAG: EsaB/YukD family protein [Pseudolysinimonas sp.]|uniref:EsaB/YukD family protein n=1 Tax=Pseudolysinimonas sp. TaxID=2680009 RepID=UPI0032641ED0
MTDLTRITIVGRSRRATLVIPGDEPLGTHLPEIARLLDQVDARGALMTSYGEQLDLAGSATDQGVVDGAVLRLVAEERLPAPPEVTDVTDRVATLRDESPGLWTQRHGLIAAAIGMGAVGASLTVPLITLTSGWVALVLLVAVTVAATATGLMNRPFAHSILLGTALGVALPVAPWIAGPIAAMLPGVGLLPVAAALAVVSVIALEWVVLAAAVGVGRRHPGAALAAAIGILLALAAIVAPALGADLVGTAGVVAALAILGLGVLPTLAISASGLAALDDEVIGGTLPARGRVTRSLHESFRVTGWAVVAVAIWLAPAIALLIGSGQLWPSLLGLAATLVAILRTRVVAMALPTWALWIAALGGALVGLWFDPAIPDVARLLILVGIGLVVAALAIVAPTAHGLIRLRRAGDTLESLATVAVIPCLLGVFGVYAFLLGVF